MTDSDNAMSRTREREMNRKVLIPLASEFEIHVVGVSFALGWPGNLYQLELATFMAEDAGEPIPVILLREPDNPHDANAIGVHVPSLGDEMGKVGHVPRALAQRMAPHLDNGVRWQGHIVQLRLDHDHPDRPGLQIKVRRVADA